MYDWVYIATPSGASLGRTIKLAKGKEFLLNDDESRFVFDIGLIRRRISSAIPDYLSEVAPGHTIFLTYDLFHTGVVYPIGFFKVLFPAHRKNPRVVNHKEYPALGVMSTKCDLDKLDPDAYLMNRNLEPETVMLGEFSNIPAELALNVYRRTDTEDHALHPNHPSLLEKIGEDKRLLLLKEKLLPGGMPVSTDQLNAKFPCWKDLDGRGKQLLLESIKTKNMLGRQHCSYALPAYPLAMLVEYELQKLLAEVARQRLLKYGSLVSLAVNQYLLSWIPDPSVHEYNLADAIRILMALPELDLFDSIRNRLHDNLKDIKNVRNRVAHSYFLENIHYANLFQKVRDVLEALHYMRAAVIGDAHLLWR